MTTPHQSPDQGMLSKWLGSGAFEIGNGGGDYNYGQDYTEEIVRSLFTLPAISALNALDLLEEQLLKMPLEALQHFKPLIPDAIEDDFEDVATAVTTIIDHLTDAPMALLRGEFDEWIQESFNLVETMVNQILEILGGGEVVPINDAVQAVKDWWATVTTGVDEAVDGLQNTWNNFWSALTGTTPSDDLTYVEPAERIGELAGTTSANSSAIAELQRRLDQEGNGAGIAGGDDFERSNSTAIGPGWAEFYSGGGYGSNQGYYYLDGHQARWVDQGATQNTATFVRTDPADEKTVTDYQKITFVVGTIAGEPQEPFQGGSHIRLWARVNDDAPTVGITDGVFIEVGGAYKAQFGVRSNGSDQFVGSIFNCTWGTGSIFTIEAGTVDGIEKFRFLKNGSPLASWSDDAVISKVGTNYRRWGWEGQARNRNLGQGTPCSCTRITITDNDPNMGGGAGPVPYDVSFVHSAGTRAVGGGDNPLGIRLTRSVTFESVYYRCATADASGNLTVELRKNGVALSGSSATIAAANQVTGQGASGTWQFFPGDILTVHVTGVGSTPGQMLVADIKGQVA
ncbi:minor tail protein [Mycobacterium phage Kimona]|uniref:Minor tail protein n=1 Tax=Mycobacterium phage Kimona TaxID=2024295 RepID=A0A249XU02_9CAUD|nr:minor tail protein [Mycobacterium phage Kimona]ASZ75464.1 minor tail protein [Mycobacterium phage Kimona]